MKTVSLRHSTNLKQVVKYIILVWKKNYVKSLQNLSHAMKIQKYFICHSILVFYINQFYINNFYSDTNKKIIDRLYIHK